MSGDLLVLGSRDVGALLEGHELDVVAAVRAAYLLHEQGRSSRPESTFLELPDPTTRIIALPTYLDADEPVAGIKWIASFPDNRKRGLPRASAVVILNSLETGRPVALLEGARISAVRTAASAALAASVLAKAPTSLGLIGCGVINREILRYTMLLCPSIERVVVHDAHPESAVAYVEELAQAGLKADTAPLILAVCADCDLVSFATTAAKPHVGPQAIHSGVSTILHVSLRDLDPLALAECDNVVDDVEHVLQKGTSLYLAKERLRRQDFIRATLAQVLEGTPPRAGAGPTVFSPFGLGVLDLAVAQLLVKQAASTGAGHTLKDFL